MSNARNLADGESRFVNTAGDTMTGNLIVDGNVGIGGAGPSTNKLHIESAGATRAVVYNSSNVVGVRIQAETGSGLIQTDTNHPLRFATNNGAVQMQIDTAGRVTMPYQPAFTVTHSSNATLSGTIILDTPTLNIGGCYNTSNGRFTAPVGGSYYFIFATIVGNSGDFAVRLMRNGSVLTGVGYASNGANDTGVVAKVIYLDAGDYINISLSSGDMEAQHTSFCGYLIG